MGEKVVNYKETVMMRIGSVSNDTVSVHIHLRAETARLSSSQWEQIRVVKTRRAGVTCIDYRDREQVEKH